MDFLPLVQQRGSPKAQDLLRSSQQQLPLFASVLLTSKACVHPFLCHLQRFNTTSLLQQHVQSSQLLKSYLLTQVLEPLPSLSCQISPGSVFLLVPDCSMPRVLLPGAAGGSCRLWIAPCAPGRHLTPAQPRDLCGEQELPLPSQHSHTSPAVPSCFAYVQVLCQKLKSGAKISVGCFEQATKTQFLKTSWFRQRFEILGTM